MSWQCYFNHVVLLQIFGLLCYELIKTEENEDAVPLHIALYDPSAQDSNC